MRSSAPSDAGGAHLGRCCVARTQHETSVGVGGQREWRDLQRWQDGGGPKWHGQAVDRSGPLKGEAAARRARPGTTAGLGFRV